MKAKAKEGGNGEAEAAKAKVASAIITAQTKAAVTRESHAQRTAQRQAQFEMEQKRDMQKFVLEQKRAEQEHQLEVRRTIEEQQASDAAKAIGAVNEADRKEEEAPPAAE